LPSLHFLQFVAARGAEALQQIDRAVDGHFAQFDEAPVRLQIGIEDFSGDVFGTMDTGSVDTARILLSLA
jgi:hypothetical protein